MTIVATRRRRRRRRRKDGVGFSKKNKMYLNPFDLIEQKKGRKNLAKMSKVPHINYIGNTRVKGQAVRVT